MKPDRVGCICTHPTDACRTPQYSNACWMSRDIWGDNSAPYLSDELPSISARIAFICLSEMESNREEFISSGSPNAKKRFSSCTNSPHCPRPCWTCSPTPSTESPAFSLTASRLSTMGSLTSVNDEVADAAPRAVMSDVQPQHSCRTTATVSAIHSLPLIFDCIDFSTLHRRTGQ